MTIHAYAINTWVSFCSSFRGVLVEGGQHFPPTGWKLSRQNFLLSSSIRDGIGTLVESFNFITTCSISCHSFSSIVLYCWDVSSEFKVAHALEGPLTKKSLMFHGTNENRLRSKAILLSSESPRTEYSIVRLRCPRTMFVTKSSLNPEVLSPFFFSFPFSHLCQN